MEGIEDRIVDALEKVLRPKNTAGETQPMGTVEMKFSKETKMFLGGLTVGAIILSAGANAIAQNIAAPKPKSK